MSKISGIRKIPTPFGKYPSRKPKQVRIRIPQSPERPLHLRSTDVVNNELLRQSPWWYTLHKRGVYRPLIGEDPLEARATPKTRIRGTLPERIVHKWLISKMHLVEGTDFTFQSSMQGGRMQLGGIVVDFLFEIEMFYINVQGPTHGGFLRGRKDEEQESIMADMGYQAYYLSLEEIYDESTFDMKMRRIFHILGSQGGSASAASHSRDETVPLDVHGVDEIYGMVRQLEEAVAWLH